MFARLFSKEIKINRTVNWGYWRLGEQTKEIYIAAVVAFLISYSMLFQYEKRLDEELRNHLKKTDEIINEVVEKLKERK